MPTASPATPERLQEMDAAFVPCKASITRLDIVCLQESPYMLDSLQQCLSSGLFWQGALALEMVVQACGGLDVM